MMYSEFLSMVKPYFVSRGIEIIGGYDNMYFYIHTGLQSSWNYANWSFKKPTEVLDSVEHIAEDGTKTYRVTPTSDWSKISYCEGKNTGTKYYHIDDYVEIETEGQRHLEFEVNPGKIRLTYHRAYKWINLSAIEQTDVKLPFPEAFIPALILKVFDTCSPMLSFEGERTPAYVKADKELQKLYDHDGFSDQESLSYDND